MELFDRAIEAFYNRNIQNGILMSKLEDTRYRWELAVEQPIDSSDSSHNFHPAFRIWAQCNHLIGAVYMSKQWDINTTLNTINNLMDNYYFHDQQIDDHELPDC